MSLARKGDGRGLAANNRTLLLDAVHSLGYVALPYVFLTTGASSIISLTALYFNCLFICLTHHSGL